MTEHNTAAAQNTSPVSASTSDEAVVTTVSNGLGRIHLNKPKAINALNTAMVQSIHTTLKEWKEDSDVQAVLLTGEGDRGLCAGGDIKAIYNDLTTQTGDSRVFWADEYAMNHLIATYPKPYIAIMDGITMGGGVGVSVHGSVRVVTETTKVGMPETGIGLFPDVGGTYLLANVEHSVGMYMGLTGLPIGAADTIAYGLADHFVPREHLGELITHVLENPAEAPQAVAEFAKKFSAEIPDPVLKSDEPWIEACFSGETVTDILAALDGRDEENAQKTADVIRSKSPRSVVVTHEMIRTASTMDLQAVLERDYRAAMNIGNYPDLVEGIRAQVIDKDRNPQWQPASIAEVDTDEISSIINDPADRKVFE